MVILHIAGLDNKKFAGPNINVPKNVLYGGKLETVGIYNCVDEDIFNDNLKKYKYYYTKEKMRKYDVTTLPEPFNKPDIVVFHSLYLFSHVLIAHKLKKSKIPYIIVPRGAMTSMAQRKKMYKKVPANILFFNRYIREAKAIHFLNKKEENDSKKFVIQDSIIIGNGTEQKKIHKEYGKEKNIFNVLFIGRIEKFHKGLDILVQAAERGKEEFRKLNIKINLYGPDEANSKKWLNQKIEELKIGDIIKINGPAYDKEKEKILLNADLFIHTSRLEGQPTSVIEAISYGLPVIVTPGTNLYNEVKNFDLGFVCELNENEIKDTILNAYNHRKDFVQISKNEINYSMKNFEWNEVVKATIDEYRRISR